MKKNIVQDVIPPKKSIRNVEIASRSRNIIIKAPKQKEVTTSKISITRQDTVREIRQEIKQDIVKAPPPPPPSISESAYNYEYDEPKGTSKKWLYSGVTLLLLVLAFGISALFKSAKISVTPKEDQKNLSDTFLAKKDGTANSLGFQLVTTTKEVQKIVTANGEQEAQIKARGKIVIYNNYSNEAQKLVATTRFETPEGLIFRLVSPTTVPGKQTVGGKSVAGSVEVLVEADKVGPNYNIPLKDFTIPGLKGDPKYTQIYARSKTEMTGGFSGMQKIISKESLAQVDSELEASLRESLSKDITTQIPANFVLYKQGLFYKFEPSVQVNGSNDGAVLKKTATVTAVIFERTTLSRAILAKVIPEITENQIRISNLDSLEFTLTSGVPFDPNTSTTLSFSLKGQTNLVWLFDENKLKSDLLGLSKKNAMAIIGTYDTVKEAWIETRPFWSQTIPSSPNKVTLVNTLTP